MVKRTIMMVLALALMLPPSLWAAQVTASADRDRLGTGESLHLELWVKGSPDGDPDLRPLERDWEILGRSQSSQMQLINGSLSRSLVLSLTLMPRRSGELEIPSVCFGPDCSLALPVTVSDQAAATSAADPLLLEAEVRQKQVAVGAQILLTLRVLHRVDLAQASLSEPRVEGVEADIRQLGKDRSFEQHRGGYLYRGIERRYALFPRKAGELVIAPLQLDAQVDAGSSRRDFFGRSVQQVRRSTESLQIRVTETPADLGTRPWLPAHSINLQDDWQKQPPTLRVGEPVTRTLTLTAEGLPAASLPELQLPVPAGWKSYPDQPTREDTENEQGIVGTLQQKLALVPTTPGRVELPAVDLDWYNVEAGRWSRVHLDPIQLEVAPAAPGSVATSPVPQTQTAPVAPVQPAPAPVTTPSALEPAPVSPGFWPWLSLALGLAWLATLALLWRTRRTKPAAKRESSPGDQQRELAQSALKAVLEAAARNDAPATRQALLHWSRLRFPQAAGRELEALIRQGGAPLAEALAELDKALYGQIPVAWNGTALSAALKNLPKEQKKTQDALVPLYPEE